MMTGSSGQVLSVVMPVYNEQETLEAIIRRVREVPLKIELLCVDDGSTDRSREILARLEAEGLVDRVILHERNQGKGRALATGFAAASGGVVIIQDADLEYDPDEYRKLLEPILDDRADVVYGSRFLGGEPHRVLYFWHYVGNRFLTLMSNMVTNLNLTDMETCYKCFRMEVLEGLEIEERGFGVEPEITAKIARGGWRVYEVGVSYSGRTYAEGKEDQLEGWVPGAALHREIRSHPAGHGAPADSGAIRRGLRSLVVPHPGFGGKAGTRRGRPRRAGPSLPAACGGSPDDAVERGDRLYGAGQIDAAIAEYRLALRQRGDEPEVLLRLGDAYGKKRRSRGISPIHPPFADTRTRRTATRRQQFFQRPRAWRSSAVRRTTWPGPWDRWSGWVSASFRRT